MAKSIERSVYFIDKINVKSIVNFLPHKNLEVNEIKCFNGKFGENFVGKSVRTICPYKFGCKTWRKNRKEISERQIDGNAAENSCVNPSVKSDVESLR